MGIPLHLEHLLGTSPGTATASGNGLSKAIGYSPTGNYNGSDSFIVMVSNGNGGSDTITVTVTINPVNDAPVCAALPLSTAEDTMGEISPSCTDADGGPADIQHCGFREQRDRDSSLRETALYTGCQL